MNNVFGSLLESNALFDLCLIIDNYIKSKYPATAGPKLTFGKYLLFLSRPGSHGLTQLLNFSRAHRTALNNSFEDFQTTIETLMDGDFAFSNNSQFPDRSIDWDFAITYGIRNFGGHRIEDQPVIYEKIEELSQRVLNTLFFLVENCV